MAAGLGDPWAEELWKLHLVQRLAGIGRLRLALPSPGLARRDPRALRFVVLLLLGAAIFVAGPDWSRRLWAGFNDSGSGAAATVDAWIDPPPYTGTGAGLSHRRHEHRRAGGSILNLRVHGAGHTPGLSLDSLTDADNGFSGAQRRIFRDLACGEATRMCACAAADAPSATGALRPFPTSRRPSRFPRRRARPNTPR